MSFIKVKNLIVDFKRFDEELDYKEVAELGLELSENCDHKI